MASPARAPRTADHYGSLLLDPERTQYRRRGCHGAYVLNPGRDNIDLVSQNR